MKHTNIVFCRKDFFLKASLGNYCSVKEVFENQSFFLKIHFLQSEKVLSCSARNSLQHELICLYLGSANKLISRVPA